MSTNRRSCSKDLDESCHSNSFETAIDIKNECFVGVEVSLDLKYGNQESYKQMDKTGEEKGGVEQGLKIDKILGDVQVNGVRYFLVKWKNSLDNGLG